MEGSGKCRPPVTECVNHRDDRYSMGHTVSGTVIACMVTDGSTLVSTAEHTELLSHNGVHLKLMYRCVH